jgi:hypothetical protein
VFEVDEAALASYLDQIEVLDVPAGGVVVLLGDFGSGKSETAEAWHRAGIKNLIAADDAPFPVWLSARDLPGQTLEGAVERQLGPTWHHGRGASIAVDGLDETDPGRGADSAGGRPRPGQNVHQRPGLADGSSWHPVPDCDRGGNDGAPHRG